MPKFRDLMSNNAGALLVLLPQDLSQLSPEEREVLSFSVETFIVLSYKYVCLCNLV